MKISIVIPAFNEEGNIVALYEKLLTVLPADMAWEIIFVDDGSKDRTLQVIKDLRDRDDRVFYLSFSRNFGHQLALKCGLDFSSGDAVISLDADLQHPPELIPQMIQKWKEGFDVIYTIRKDRDANSKSTSSKGFYKLMNWLSDVRIESGAADFRLLDKRIIEIIRNNKEQHLFLRGFISWVGFRQFSFDYTPKARFSGKTKYSYRKMISFAINGITSFSIKPLRFSILLGILISAIAFGYAFYAIYAALFTEWTVPGWASVLVSVQLIGGIQLVILGVIGEYLGKLFMQSKNRPNYIVRESALPPVIHER